MPTCLKEVLAGAKRVKQSDSSIPKRSAENSDKGKERIGYLGNLWWLVSSSHLQ
ncbi:hypothetical protein CJ030_MR2G020045 [Morella rubra]|uniref:Uncharacterized protein n=1 Tax=Morella rubra TaxID=262757 RepID=A0A6A1WCH2_9ROSI|nr:hypothetical protein CJ030_MR2G020045 [Morella rubra]